MAKHAEVAATRQRVMECRARDFAARADSAEVGAGIARRACAAAARLRAGR